MALVLKTDTIKHGFYTKWILKKQQITSLVPLITEVQQVEGMPNVKWYLKWNYSPYLDTCSLSINIESDEEIEYIIYRPRCSNPRETDIFTGRLTEKKDIVLIATSSKAFLGCLVNDDLANIVHGYIFYTQPSKASNLEIGNAAEWVLRLKENIVEDFDIVVNGQIIKIHKPFLAAESPVFAKMFEGNYKEATEKKVTVIDFEHKIVQAAVNYCYGKNIASIIDDENDEINLLFFCDKYDFQTLKPKLEAHLIKKLCAENVSTYITIADQVNALLLRQACADLICGIIDRRESHPNIDLKTFDKNFMADVLQQLLNRSSSNNAS